MADDIRYYTPINNKGVASRWIVHISIVIPLLLLTTFLSGLKLDFNLTGGWFLILSPLYAAEGLFLVVLLAYLLHVHVTMSMEGNTPPLQQKSAKLVETLLWDADQQDIIEKTKKEPAITIGESVDPDDVNQLEVFHTNLNGAELKVYAPSEYTVTEVIVYICFLGFAIWQQTFIALQVNETMALNWYIVMLPTILYSSIAIVYYLNMWMTWRCGHLTLLSGKIAWQRGATAILLLLFALLLSGRMEYPLRIHTWEVFMPLIFMCIFPLLWLFDYYQRSHAEYSTYGKGKVFSKLLVVFHYLSLFEVMLFVIVAICMALNFIFLILQIDGHLNWSWVIVLLPLMIAEGTISLTACGAIWLPSTERAETVTVLTRSDESDTPSEVHIVPRSEALTDDQFSNI